jgi:DNA (cytosine-5)-methyltransferase 1
LPTPRASEPGSTSVGYGDSLNDFANRIVFGKARKDLLPTTRAQNGEDRNNKIWYRDPSKPQNLENALAHVVLDVPDSSLLRSPTASQASGGALGESVARERGNTVGIRDQAMDLARLNGYKVTRVVANLPTPTTRDYKDGQYEHVRDGKVQTDTIARAIFNSGEVKLMGTPRTSSANGSSSKQVELGAPKARIEDQVLLTNWGKFEPAIRRWEAVLGRPAPAPTKPDGKEGNHRLSSKFTEWMMGLPEGWITGHGLKRNDELKLAGNGVVPAQAELALRTLLGNING